MKFNFESVRDRIRVRASSIRASISPVAVLDESDGVSVTM
jgi:hypothetical protein